MIPVEFEKYANGEVGVVCPELTSVYGVGHTRTDALCSFRDSFFEYLYVLQSYQGMLCASENMDLYIMERMLE